MRHSRSIRKTAPSRLRLRESDFWILEALAKMLFLTTAQLARLFFKSSRWSTNKCMRTLLDAGYVRVFVRSLAQENIYSLNRAGANALRNKEQERANERETDEIQKMFRTPKGLDGNINHLLAINDVRIAIAPGVPALGAELVGWRSDWELRAASRAGVLPDARFAIRWNEAHEQEFTLELDNNTRSVKGFLKKMFRYQAMHDSTELCVLVIGRDPRWIEHYRQAVIHTKLDVKVFFATLDVIAGCCSADVWTSANGNDRYSLQDLAFVPNRKERTCAEWRRNEGASHNEASSYIPDSKGSFGNQ